MPRIRRPRHGRNSIARATSRAAFAALLLLPLIVGCDTHQRPAAPMSPAVTGAPPEAVRNESAWPLPGKDYANARAASGSTIDASNVGSLVQAWEVEVEFGLTTVPLIADGVVYVQDRAGGVKAIDLATGGVRWSAPASGLNTGPNGVALGWGRVFGVTGSAIFALDAATGHELWNTKLATSGSDGIDIQPTVFDGMVIVSTVPISLGGIYKGGDHGVIYALDTMTGMVRWSFDTVEPGLWGNPALNAGGGAWYPPAIDAARGLVYIGTGNPAPFPGTAEYPNGSSRPGANLYTDSAVALDAHTGELRWFYQVHPHDLFDRDQVHTMLVDIPGEGSAVRQVVVSAGKGGHIVGLDPDSGHVLWDTPVGLHSNDDLEALAGATEIAPGTFGGVLTPPAWADGVAYVAAVNAPQVLEPDKTSYFGAKLGVMDGEVIAIDARSGAVLWDAKVPGDPMGGVTVVNDLVFTATLQGSIVALDRATGAIVWRTEAPGGIIGWMSVAGATIIVPVGNAKPPRLLALRLPAE